MEMTKNNKKNSIRQYLRKLGPGLITGLSDDDPSGIATYSQAGAQFGLATLWTALLTFPLMFAVQEMCARIGMVTSNGLTANIKQHYSKVWLYAAILLMVPTLVFNISANITSMGAVIHMIIPVVPSIWAAFLVSVVMIFCLIYLNYKKIVSVLKYLCATVILYLLIPFFNQQNVGEILKNTFFPVIHFNKDYISILVAVLGTTISPYLFFWQATMSAENKRTLTKRLTKKNLSFMVQDVGIGMFTSNIIMYFIILTTGTILFDHGIRNIVTVEQAAGALEPLAGKLSYLLFAFGIIGSGFLSISVLSSCLSYILCTSFDCDNGLNKKFKNAKVFYFLILLSIFLGFMLDIIGLNPIKALVFSAIANGLISPPLLLIILLMANNPKIMKKKTNGKLSNFFGVLTFLMMSLSSIAMIYFWVVETFY